jgi:hypothetical protein
LEQSGTEGEGRFMCSSRVLDMQVEMHLLGAPMRPVGRNVAGCQLYADSPLSSGVNDAVPIAVLEYVPTENARPEGTLGMEIDRIEDDYLTDHLHRRDTIRGLV